MTDLSERLSNRVQISSDSLRSYVDAVERAFGEDVDCGQIVKFYHAEPIGPGRYAPPRATGVDKYDVDQKIWNWRNANPTIKVIKTYPAETLPLHAKSPTANHARKGAPQDRLSVKIDYEQPN